MDYTSLIKEINIPELIKALRECASDDPDCIYNCPYYNHDVCADDLKSDAAVAIEALMDAEKTYLSELAQCHENLRRAAETRRERDERIEALQAEVEELKRVNMELFDDLPKYGDKILHWVSVDERLPEPYIQCLVRDNDCNYAVGYYRQDVKAWDSPFFGWLERDDEYYEDGDLCRIGNVVAWMSIEPSKEVQK